MTKAIFKYLLSISILLLGLSNQLSARTNREVAFFAPVKNISVNNHQPDLVNIFTTISHDNRENLFYDSEEEHKEDDDEESYISHKKNVANTYITSSPFYNWYAKLFLVLNTSQVLHFGKHFSHYPLYKLFIVFSVFRI